MRQKIIEGLPVAGIIAFSGCSVNALAHWLLDWSLNPTWWFWPAAILVEGCTAWLVWSVVDTLRMLTRSRISKQDRRFYKIIFLVFAMLAIPSIFASVVANYIEFQGNPLLACLFPILTIACAVGTGLPDVVRRHKKEQAEAKAAAKADKAAAKAAQDAELVRQQTAEKDKPATLVRQWREVTRQEGGVADDVRQLSDKATRLSWLRDNWPVSDVYPADLADIWQVTLRTVSRYLSEIKDEVSANEQAV